LNHKRNLPLKHIIIIDKATRDAIQILGILDPLQLVRQNARRSCKRLARPGHCVVVFSNEGIRSRIAVVESKEPGGGESEEAINAPSPIPIPIPRAPYPRPYVQFPVAVVVLSRKKGKWPRAVMQRIDKE